MKISSVFYPKRKDMPYYRFGNKRLYPRREKLTHWECALLKKKIEYRLKLYDWRCRLSKPRVRYKLSTHCVHMGTDIRPTEVWM